jgi:serine/threonine-protein kinase
MPVPQQLGSYLVERELGRGGMGVVYLARDPRLNRSVAIKLVPEALAHNSENLARFEREARLLAAVNHPNIAAIYGVEEAAGQRLLILEYVPGDTLSDRLGRGPLPVREALDITRQIAAAIETAHEGGIIHRDLKPANVKVTPDGLVKVLDFGLAKGGTAATADLAQSPTVTYSPTGVGVILGTAGYMSPEQARGKPVDRRADIWAFACVLYECLTGRKAFEGETVSDTIARIIEREPDLDALPPSTPPPVRALLSRCFEKDVRKRQRDIGDVRLEIENLLADRASVSTVVQPVTMSRPAMQRFGLPALCAIGGVAAGIALWSAVGARPEPVGREMVSVAVSIPATIRLGDVRFTPAGHDLIVTGFPKRADGTDDPKPRLYLRKLGSFDFTEIPGTEGVDAFARSPNGPWLAVRTLRSDQSGDRQLVRVAIDGSSPPVTITVWDRDWTNFTWLRDDDLLIMRDLGTKFFRLPSSGGSPQPAVTFDFGNVIGFPTFAGELPGARGVFIELGSYGSQGYREDVLVLDARTGKTTKILDNAANPAYDAGSKHLLFSRNTTLLAVPFDPASLAVGKDSVALFDGLRANSWSHGDFAVADDGTLLFDPGGRQGSDRRIVTVDSTRQLTPLMTEPRGYELAPAISADGRQVAVTIPNTRGNYETWTAWTDRPGLRRTIAQPNADCLLPTWSRDRQWLAFTRLARDKTDGVYVIRADGSGEAKLVMPADGEDRFAIISDWLPDSSGVLITTGSGPKYQPVLVRIAKDGTASPPAPARESTIFTSSVKVSPDGTLALFSAEDSGRPELYVAEFRNGKIGRDPVPVGGSGPLQESRWASDSTRYYFLQDGTRIMTGTIERRPSLRASAPALAYDLTALHLVPTAFDIMPDGRLLGIQLGVGEENRVSAGIVLNWLEAARKKLLK